MIAGVAERIGMRGRHGLMTRATASENVSVAQRVVNRLGKVITLPAKGVEIRKGSEEIVTREP